MILVGTEGERSVALFVEDAMTILAAKQSHSPIYCMLQTGSVG
jgi:hypothetical protein